MALQHQRWPHNAVYQGHVEKRGCERKDVTNVDVNNETTTKSHNFQN